jgi:hypothetical protein
LTRLAVAAALAAVTVAATGCVELKTVPSVSATCTQPTAMSGGFFANRGVYFRVSAQQDPTDPQESWICYRLKVPDQPEQAGRIDVDGTTSTGGARLTTDLQSRACATGTENALGALPHPIEEGEVLDTPFYIDAYARAGDPAWGEDGIRDTYAWLCVEAGPLKQRVIAEAGRIDDPHVVHNADPTPGAIQDTTPPPAGKASTTCSAGAYGPATELVNAHLIGSDLFLYTARPADDELHVCARLSSAQASGGLHLRVKAATSQVVDIRQSSDTTPCTQDVVTLSNLGLSIRRSPVGQMPPSVCVNGTRYTFVTGPLPPVVSFELDS